VALHEKNSELVALRASIEETHEKGTMEVMKQGAIKISELERDIEILHSKISAKDAELAMVKKQLKVVEDENTRMKKEASSSQELWKSSFENAKAEAESLRQLLASSKGSGEKELCEAKEEACNAQSKANALCIQLDELKKELVDAQSKNRALENESLELAAAKKQLEQMNLEMQELPNAKGPVDMPEHQLGQAQEQMQHAQTNRASPSSESTGVKVDTHASIPTESNDDGWGDEDW